MTEVEKKWILSLPLERKIDLMKSMLEEDEIGDYLAFVNMLLEAPISEGGVSTDLINRVFNMYSPKMKK
jgi:hypothetical protein